MHNWPPGSSGSNSSRDEQGGIRITDRKKDIIVVSEFKLFPSEIEDVLTMYRGVREAGVIGVPGRILRRALREPGAGAAAPRAAGPSRLAA